MDTLLTLAEVAITMAGFSAIVVIFKRRTTELWRKTDADRFHGMVIHAIVAALFCFLPFLLIEFSTNETDALRVCSGLLCVTTTVIVANAVRLEGTSNAWIRVIFVCAGGIIVVLQGINAIWSLPGYVLGLYLVGVFWHLVQAAILFVMLIWIPASQTEIQQ